VCSVLVFWYLSPLESLKTPPLIPLWVFFGSQVEFLGLELGTISEAALLTFDLVGLEISRVFSNSGLGGGGRYGRR